MLFRAQLRHRQREHYIDGQTTSAAHAAQQLRVRAYRCLRDTYDAIQPSGVMAEELELGAFGSIGLGIGSPPRTPADERATREWAAEATVAQVSVEEIAAMNKAHVEKNTTEELTADELIAWLSEKPRRGNTSIDDICMYHGVEPLPDFGTSPRGSFRRESSGSFMGFRSESFVDSSNGSRSGSFVDSRKGSRSGSFVDSRKASFRGSHAESDSRKASFRGSHAENVRNSRVKNIQGERASTLEFHCTTCPAQTID